MGWRLATDVSFCWCNGKAIFLDACRDRYFALPDTASLRFAEWLQNPNGVPPELLTRSALIARDPSASLPIAPCTVSVPSKDLDDLSPDPITSCSVLTVAKVMLATRHRLRTKRFDEIVSRIRNRAPQHRTGSAEHFALGYAKARRRLPLARQCLRDSLALIDFLAARGVGASLVFGVMTEPFGAHCWVQSERAILNDQVDNISRFTPILAL